jgi:hypothetical protein
MYFNYSSLKNESAIFLSCFDDPIKFTSKFINDIFTMNAFVICFNELNKIMPIYNFKLYLKNNDEYDILMNDMYSDIYKKTEITKIMKQHCNDIQLKHESEKKATMKYNVISELKTMMLEKDKQLYDILMNQDLEIKLYSLQLEDLLNKSITELLQQFTWDLSEYKQIQDVIE